MCRPNEEVTKTIKASQCKVGDVFVPKTHRTKDHARHTVVAICGDRVATIKDGWYLGSMKLSRLLKSHRRLPRARDPKNYPCGEIALNEHGMCVIVPEEEEMVKRWEVGDRFVGTRGDTREYEIILVGERQVVIKCVRSIQKGSPGLGTLYVYGFDAFRRVCSPKLTDFEKLKKAFPGLMLIDAPTEPGCVDYRVCHPSGDLWGAITNKGYGGVFKMHGKSYAEIDQLIEEVKADAQKGLDFFKALLGEK